MPGVNILGNCNIFREAEHPATGCTIDWSITGQLTLTTTFTSGATSESTTTGSVSETESFTRIPFVYADYANSNFPGPGEMWLMQEQCCCPCRLILWLGGHGQMVYGITKEFDSDTHIVDTPPPGDPNPPSENNFHNDGIAVVSVTLNAGVWQTTGWPGRAPCRGAEEGNGNLIFVDMDYANNLFVFTHLTNDDLTGGFDTGDGDTAGLVTDNDVPGILSVQMGNVYCNGLTMNIESDWGGTTTVSGPSSSTEETFAISLNFSITLT